MIDERARRLREPTLARLELRIQRPFAGCSRNGNDGHQREPLVGDDLIIAHQDARSSTSLFVTHSWIKQHKDHRPTHKGQDLT